MKLLHEFHMDFLQQYLKEILQQLCKEFHPELLLDFLSSGIPFIFPEIPSDNLRRNQHKLLGESREGYLKES